MLFPTVTFAIFFFAVLPLSWLLMPERRWWKVFILLASWEFLAYAHQPEVLGVLPMFVVLLVGSSVWNWYWGRRIAAVDVDRTRRLMLIVAVVGNLALLGYFKYYDFFIVNLVNAAHEIGVSIPLDPVQVVLPVAISFYTFCGMSYVIDVFRRDFMPVSLSNFLVYQSFFPHLIAGPVVRASEFVPQIDARHDPRRVDASQAFALIVGGLFKKLVIADFLGRAIVQEVFPNPGPHGTVVILIAVYAYAVQIYADFSGYTDIAIGLAALLGFRFPQNFDRPYTATSVQDFWKRWHMTLSRWLRDYLYIPLGGNRRVYVWRVGWVNVADTGGPGAMQAQAPHRARLRWFVYANLMITMVLGGLWHGAGGSFLLWGALLGFFLVVEHARRARRVAQGISEPVLKGRRLAWARIRTFHLICLGWVFFPTRMGDLKSPSLSDSFLIVRRIVLPTEWQGGSMALVKGSVILAIAVGIGGQFVPRAFGARVLARWSRRSPIVIGIVLGFALLIINVLGIAARSGRVPDFIYFQF